MRLLLAVVVALSVGCSAGMHRAYQVSMVGVASVADAHSLLQTRAALHNDPTIVESNPMLGHHPSDARLVGAGLVNLSIGAAILALPRDRGPESDWIVDVLATSWAALTVSWAVNDTRLTSERWYR